MSNFNKNMTAVLLLTVVAFVLRVYALGDLGFRWDEDLTAIAVKAVNQHGYPLLDSGMVYPRFLPLQYLLAAWTSVFGFSEFSIRFPIVLFGTALIPLTYVVARDLVDERVALIAAAFMTLDFWQVELARTARMYAPFFVAYALFVVSVYRGILWENRRWKIAILPLGFLAISLHDVGIFCAGIVLIPALLSEKHRHKPIPYVVSVILVAFAALLRKLSVAMWSLSLRGERMTESVAAAHLADSWQGIRNFLNDLSQILYLPEFSLLRELLSSGIGVAVWLVTFALLLIVAYRAARHEKTSVKLMALSAVAFASIHQFTLALVVLILFVGIQLQGIRGFLEKNSITLGAVLLFLLAFWFCVAFVLGHGIADAKFVVKTLFEYPRFRMTMAYPITRPLMSALAAIGGCILFDRYTRPAADKKSAVLLWCFLISYPPIGVFASTYGHFRYVLHADVFFMGLASIGTFVVAGRLIVSYAYFFRRAGNVQTKPAVTTLVAIVIVLMAVNPVRSVLAVTRDYVADGRIERWMGLGTYPDYKTTSAYILANSRPSDQILVLNPREYYNYLGKVDGWVRTHSYRLEVVYWDGAPHDKYIGVPLIQSVDGLKHAIASHDGRTWLPFKRRVLDFERYGGVDDQIAEFLRSSADRQVMMGKDESMVVYLFENLR